MIDPQRPSSSRITLEDLLRLKRAERPPAEFWVDFERSLREKQLAAIVEKRPWWTSWKGFSRWSVPVGAAAALTVTFAALTRVPSRYHSAKAVVSTEALPIGGPVVNPLVTTAEPAAPSFVVSPASSVGPSDSSSTATVASSEEPVPAAVVVADLASSNRLASVTEQIAGIGLDQDTDADKTGSSRFTSVSSKDAPTASEDLNAFFAQAVAKLDSGIHSEKVSFVEPLSQVPSPRDSRRARLLAFTSSVDTHSPQYSNNSNVIRSRERITSHLNEEALYDSIRRLGIKNGGVSIQF